MEANVKKLADLVKTANLVKMADLIKTADLVVKTMITLITFGMSLTMKNIFICDVVQGVCDVRV